MKKIALLRFSTMLAVACMVMAACSKSGTSPVVGQWELSEAIGGMAGAQQYPPGNGNILEFDNNGDYKVLQPGSPVMTGKYKIAQPMHLSGKFELTRIFPGTVAYSMTNPVQIGSNKLIISPEIDCCDVETVIYLRK
jgi:hypothetical protein